MSDHDDVTRLQLLYGLRRYLTRELRRVDAWIAQEQQREQERRRGEQARPPAPDWLIELGIGQGRPAVLVHAGGCDMVRARWRAVDRTEAWRQRDAGVDGCTHCALDAKLGYLEG